MLSPYRIVVNRSATRAQQAVVAAVREVFPNAVVVFETWPTRSSLVLEVSKLDGSPTGSSASDIEEVLNRCLQWGVGLERQLSISQCATPQQRSSWRFIP